MAKSNAGRPKIIPDDAMCKKAESLAAQGLTLEQIAHTLGISYDTLNERKKELGQFSEAIALGKAKGIATVTNALFNKAKDGDVPAMKYYLNNRDNANWKDKIENTHTGPNGGDIMIDTVFTVKIVEPSA
jgi:hypothetical protein